MEKGANPIIKGNLYRRNIVELKPSNLQKKILHEMMLLSSCVYNMANYEFRKCIFKKEKIPSFFELRSLLQEKNDYKLLGRSYAAPKLNFFSEMISSRFKLIKSRSQKYVNLPKYFKNRKTNTTIPSFILIDYDKYKFNKFDVRIPLSFKMRKKYGSNNLNIDYNGILKWKGKQCRGQIRYQHKKFYLYQSVEIEDPKPASSEIYASIDLGIKNLVTTVTNTDEELIIGSNRFFEQWKYHSKLISQEQARLSKSKKLTSRRLQSMYFKRSVYHSNLLNNIVCKTFRFFKRHNVQTIYVGDLKGIGQSKNRGALLNRMINNYWSYAILRQKIQNKAEELGIKVVLLDESYTSQDCNICGSRNKPKDRIYLCEFCGNIEHRDILGAKNILDLGMRDLRWRSAHQDETILLSEELA